MECRITAISKWGEFLMTDYLVTDTELTSIADAIRTKGGTSANLSFPTEFVSAINAIETGGGGLEYEEGIYTPTEDIARPTVAFENTHTKTPAIVVMSDVTGTADATTNSNYTFGFFDPFRLWGQGFPYTSTGFRYAIAVYGYRASSTNSISASTQIIQYDSDNQGSTYSSYSRYWVTATNFCPYSGSSSRYWRAGRTYKWIAIWK